MAKGKRYVSRTGDKQLRENPGGHHLQIAVAVITGVFAVSAAVLSAILGSGNNGGSSSPGQHPVASSPVLPSLSAPAMSLIDLRMKSCLGATSPVPDIGEVAITSPPSGAATDIHGTIHGTAKLSGSVQLYFFAYSDGPCAYYFMPSPIGVKADDSWQVQLYLEGNVPGDKVFLYAAVVGPDANATLRDIIHYFDVKDESAYVYELPSGTRAAHIDVVISS